MVLWTRPSYNMLSSWTAWRIPLGLVAVPTCSSHSNPTVAVELGRYPCKWSKMMVAVTNISPRKIAYVEIKTVFFVCRIPCWWRVLSVSCLQEWDNYSKFIEIHLQTLQKIHMFFRASTHITSSPVRHNQDVVCLSFSQQGSPSCNIVSHYGKSLYNIMWSHLPLPIGTYSLVMAGHRWNRWKAEGCEGEWLRGGLCVTCFKSVIVYSNNLVDGRSGDKKIGLMTPRYTGQIGSQPQLIEEASTQEIYADLWRCCSGAMPRIRLLLP